MKPRSAALNVRITVPRSITLAICSRPSVNLMLSTAVSIAGNVLSTCSIVHARRERRVALRIERLGLRHAAGHPQHDHGVGGRGLLCGAGGLPPAAERGSRPTSAASVAAAVAPMKPRRLSARR